jgi:S-adenosylmethionine uptake transporter
MKSGDLMTKTVSKKMQTETAQTLTVNFNPPVFLRWFFLTGYPQGAFWACMICLVSNLNDVLMKDLGSRLPVIEIIFFRFLFSMFTLLPFMMRQGRESLRMQRPSLHMWRAVIGVAAIGCSCLAVTVLPLTDVTTLFFTQPLFFLPLAVLVLRERVPYQRILATVIGFGGILIIIQPHPDYMNWAMLIPISGALLFAVLDVFAKKMVMKESSLTMLFSFALGTTVVAALPAFWYWVTPNWIELIFLFLLGGGANLIQVCLFQAFSATQASALAPFRYVELLFSTFFGFMLFSEVVKFSTLIGAVFIIFSTLFNTYHEMGINLFSRIRGKKT